MKPNVLMNVVLGALLCGGCSKKGGTGPAADAGTGSTEAAAPASANPLVAASLDEISKKIEAQQYDKAVGSLMELQGFPKSAEEQARYQMQVQQAFNVMSQKAAAGDQEARQNMQMLGRAMTGR
jgi:hypothetical protein